MKDTDNTTDAFSERFGELRRKAEARLEQRRRDPESKSDDDRDLHELMVFQEELLVQQESLVEVNARLDSELTRARALFDEAPIPYMVLDGIGAIRELNHAAATALGRPRGELVRRNFAAMLTAPTSQVFLSMLRVVNDLEERRTCEVELAGPGSRWRVQMSSTDSNDGKDRRCLVSALDVTAQHLAEEELRAARREAERASRLRGRFLANMSHEVRTPLTLVLGLVDSVLRSPLEPEVERRLRIVRRAGDNLLGVLNDVVDFARIEANRLRIESRAFRTREPIEHVCSLFAAAAEQRGISLTYSESERAPVPDVMVGDPSRLGQVLVNLVSNALKHTPKGGRITLTAAYRSTNLIMGVEDSGPGIPEDQLERIFQPFRQVEEGDARPQGGAGLGLAISRQVLRLMGGELFVRNVERGGALFTLQVPLHEAQPGMAPPDPDFVIRPPKAIDVEPTGPERPPPAPPDAEAQVLVVDDDAQIRFLVGLVLRDAGFSYDEVGSAQEALDRMRERHYGVVLMDIQMPGLDGLDAVRLVKADPELRDHFVVALTARAMHEELAEITEAGFDAYLPKPIDFDGMTALIAKQLERSGA